MLNPPDYNTIMENESFFVILKRTDSEPFLFFPFKDIQVRVGRKNNDYVLHSLFYPKRAYGKDEVFKIANETEECPLCVRGFRVTDISDEKNEELIKYSLNKSNIGVNMDLKQALKKMSDDFSAPKKGADTDDLADFLTEGTGALGAMATGFLFDQISNERLWGKILKGVVGAGALGLTLLPGDLGMSKGVASASIKNPLKISDGMRKSLRTMGWSSLVCAFDPRPEDIEQMATEAKAIGNQFQRAFNLGPADVVNVIKDRFKMPDMNSQLSKLNLGKLNLAAGAPGKTEIRGLPEMGKEKRIASKRINIR